MTVEIKSTLADKRVSLRKTLRKLKVIKMSKSRNNKGIKGWVLEMNNRSLQKKY